MFLTCIIFFSVATPVFFTEREKKGFVNTLGLLNQSGLIEIENYATISSITILITSILMVSKLPTYSLKRILIPRSLAVFLLLGIGIYVSLLIFYTFETLFFTGVIYLLLIPISFFHYRLKNKKTSTTHENENDEEEL